MNQRTIASGETVYSQHGQEAEFVAATGGEYIVRPIYEDEDGPRTGDVETWRQVFRTPPAPKLDEKTAEAEKRLMDLQQKVSDLRSEEHRITSEMQARKDRIKEHEALADLDRYLAGEITHYVAVHSYYPSVEIIPVGQTVEDYSSSDGYGLLSLMPSRKWDKRIVFSVYYKDRGRDRYSSYRREEVFLCCSENAAKAKAAEVIQLEVDEAISKDRKDRRYVRELIASCEKHSVPVPQELVDGMAEVDRLALTKQRDELAAKLVDVQNKLAEVSQ